MNEFNIGDKVILKDGSYLSEYLGEEVGTIVGIDTIEDDTGKYLVKFDSLDMCTGWLCGIFCNDPELIIEPYEGYAEWIDKDDIIKVEDECGKGIKSEFNIGDKVIAKNGSSFGEEVGTIVGLDPREGVSGKYLVKFDSSDMSEGLAYEDHPEVHDYIVEPYEGYATWLDDVIKVNIIKVEEEKCMGLKFSLGQNVMHNGKECKIVGIDKSHIEDGFNHCCYLITTNMVKCVGTLRSNKETFKDEDCITFLDGISDDIRCTWVMEEDIEEIQKDYEFKDEAVLNQCNYRGERMIAEADTNEEDIKTKFNKIREQKKQIVKEMSEKVLQLTLEIKEIEHEIERIKKEWHL